MRFISGHISIFIILALVHPFGSYDVDWVRLGANSHTLFLLNWTCSSWIALIHYSFFNASLTFLGSTLETKLMLAIISFDPVMILSLIPIKFSIEWYLCIMIDGPLLSINQNVTLLGKHMEVFTFFVFSFSQLIVSYFGAKTDGYTILDVARCVYYFILKII